MKHEVEVEKTGGHYRWLCSCGAFDVSSSRKSTEKSAAAHTDSHSKE